ncbi:hypothetical protein [Kribbella sp. CA-293567]|uniref:hypothetical protein n=1 Tax=Kribbella sp. CA-293567 TaxID=3002436 RepID=UPI0022DD5F34|nr:hypothetical protein [Kribbella sp. CA-293567]WBQ05989.1 hypothetical protein OX958_04105 [Kribbella sp. CA-293567]
MTWGKLAGISAIACTAFGLVACSPTESGVIGLSVDESGRTIVVLQDCGGDIDQLKLWDRMQTSTSKDDVVLTEWYNTRSPKGIVQFPLVEGAGRWKSEQRVPDLDAGRSYSLTGRNKNGSSNAAGLDFTPELVKSLQPGQILKTKILPKVNSTEVVTLDEFTPRNCD